jgi:NAD(P)-dependent dehydrogenase (short-subunit alcohol dehydrogenase family)
MQTLTDQTIVVAGATGNLGPFIARALLERGAIVAAVSRSGEKLGELRKHLARRVADTDVGRLRMFVGDLSDNGDAARLRERIGEDADAPRAVIASVGEFVTTPSILDASDDELRRALDGSVIAHLRLARTFLPPLSDSGGTYVFLQGPLAFELRPQLGAHPVSIATAAQHMLFRALAQELGDSPARVVELVTHAFIRNWQTQPASPLAGEAVGAFAAHLLSGAGEERHGQSIHLRSVEQLAAVGLAREHPTKERT